MYNTRIKKKKKINDDKERVVAVSAGASSRESVVAHRNDSK